MSFFRYGNEAGIEVEPVKPIPVKWIVITIGGTLLIFNFCVVLLYLYMNYEQRTLKKAANNNNGGNGNGNGNSARPRVADEEGIEMGPVNAVNATGQRVTIITNNVTGMVEIEDNFDPWAYWATDSESEDGTSAPAGGARAVTPGRPRVRTVVSGTATEVLAATKTAGMTTGIIVGAPAPASPGADETTAEASAAAASEETPQAPAQTSNTTAEHTSSANKTA